MVKAELARVASRVNDPTAGFTPPRGDTAPTPSRGTPVVPNRPPPAVSGFHPVQPGPVTAGTPGGSGAATTTGSIRTGRPAGAAIHTRREWIAARVSRLNRPADPAPAAVLNRYFVSSSFQNRCAGA